MQSIGSTKISREDTQYQENSGKENAEVVMHQPPPFDPNGGRERTTTDKE